ncbi:MAG TPA: hypothetical protein VFB69_00035 [Candidatus Dormibacteraeota bacterium]|nr:hypothetical protein [Candidatus Dormibacteraeota bacterium]
MTYYLNLGYAGTDAIAIRKTEVPKPIADALSVWHGARKLAADVDSMVVYLPGLSKEPMASSSRALSTTIENIFGNRFHEVTVVVLACKTSWSDSIQTPMLWNFVYELRRRGPIPGTLSIGSGLFALDGLHSFSYAFITAPSQKKAEFKPDNLPVLRGETMLGGHFWGRPSKQSIAPSVAEFYSRQANRVRIAPLRKVGVALANEARTGAGLVSLTAFDLA